MFLLLEILINRGLPRFSCLARLNLKKIKKLDTMRLSYFSDIQNGMRLTLKLEEEYYTNNLCIIDAVQICIRFHPSLQIVFKTLKLKFWS